jgi:hypothetical protein
MTSAISRNRKALTHLLDLMTAVAILGALYSMFSSNGIAGSRIKQWRHDQRTLAFAEAAATDIEEHASRLGGDGTSRYLIEVGDYECPFCRANQPVVDSLMRAGIQVRFVHLPLDNHKQARSAALAVICAEAGQSAEALHLALMRSSDWSAAPDWTALARTAGHLDTSRFTSCIRSEEPRERLDRNVQLAKGLEVSGTPTYIGTRGVVRGLATLSQLLAIVE